MRASELLMAAFLVPYAYIMHEDAVEAELLSPGLREELLSCGLKPIEITIEEFLLADEYGPEYIRLSVHDRVALAIAKNRGIALLTGDGALRKAAKAEGVEVIGMLGILDKLWTSGKIITEEYRYCLERLLAHNAGAVRLPKNEILSRLEAARGSRPASD